MNASTKTTQNHSWVSRLIVSLTIGLMMLALGATTAFAGTGIQTTQYAVNPVISTGGDKVTLDEDCDDGDDDDCEEGGGGGLPATDTAPLAATGVAISAGGAQVTLDEDDDEDDEDDDEDDGDDEGGSGGGGLPATDTAPLAASSDTSAPLPAVALLVIVGLAGGAMKVASKRSI